MLKITACLKKIFVMVKRTVTVPRSELPLIFLIFVSFEDFYLGAVDWLSHGFEPNLDEFGFTFASVQ